ncbi:transcriptional regulator [Georgenia yuyongxinii]|uniref:Transcriptional regulator n=1 Tax=Georgenia yuyongxinii TaxID=2589797 RepID=A0A5B8C748_9MICO|nr:transcriptional regulator [Georgenia yuyongxinii]QDC24982.1 transcriptional regulator [Georgenia yuyongxinii]
MSDVASHGTLERARSAAAVSDWHEAFDLLVGADADNPLAPNDLALLGEVAYAAGSLDTTIEAWERAHAAYMQSGEVVAAAGAAVRVAMHLLFDTALMAPVRGWLARAERLLEGQEEAPAHAWFAAVRANERMLTGDLTGARGWARAAIEIGSRRDLAASAIGGVAEGRLLILDGHVQQGLALLDQAGVAAVSGDLDPLSTGVVYCELVCALQGLAQYDLAEEWTEAMERWCQTNAVGSVHGRCRVHRAEILRLRGSCGEAERQALMACEELRPYLRRELGWPLNELGRIRLHKADIEGAEEALLAAHRAGWDPQPGLALVRLAQGAAATAAESIRDALERPVRVPSKERPPSTDLQRAPLLEAQVEIEIAAGDMGRARSAADELALVAARYDNKALVAGAILARGRVRLADGDAAGAEECVSEAVRLWNEVGAPYEAARARMDLAKVHAVRGSEHRAFLELEAARTILDGIAAAPSLSPPEHAERQHAADEQPAESVNVFRRDGDYWTVSFDGRTVRLRDLKGMRYLARLLAESGREYHVLDLVAAEARRDPRADSSQCATLPHSALGDAGELLDARAKDAYRRRLTEIEDDIDQARAIGDAERLAQADAERDFLVRELARAFGLGGRDRRAASASERARAAVTRAIRQAMARIGEHDPPLGEHLSHAIHTGTYCAYRPDPRAPAWWQS